MGHTSRPKNKEGLRKSKKNSFFIFLVVFCGLAGGSLYIFYSNPFLKKNKDLQLETPNNSDCYQSTLRNQEEETSPSNFKNIPLSDLNKVILQKISDNFQKMFLFGKIERRLLTGENISEELRTLSSLVGLPLQKKQFDVLRNNAEGILSLSEILFLFQDPEKILKKSEQKNIPFLSDFFRVSPAQDKRKMKTLALLIREDRMKKSIEFIEKNFPEHQEWRTPLEKRLIIKQALKALEKVIFDGLRVEK